MTTPHVALNCLINCPPSGTSFDNSAPELSFSKIINLYRGQFSRKRRVFVTVVLLQETSAVLSLWKLCEERGYTYQWKSGQNPRELIAIYPTMYHLGFLEYQRVLPLLRLHLPLHHLHHRIQYLMLTNTQKIQCKKEVEVRVKSFWETRCMKPQKSKTKNGESEEVQRDISHELPDWLQEIREKLVDGSTSTEP